MEIKKPKLLRKVKTKDIEPSTGIFGKEEPLGQDPGDLTADSTLELPHPRHKKSPR